MTTISVHFYNIDQREPRNVIRSWTEVAAVPRVGEQVDLDHGTPTYPEMYRWDVRAVRWTKPTGGDVQTVDIVVEAVVDTGNEQ